MNCRLYFICFQFENLKSDSQEKPKFLKELKKSLEMFAHSLPIVTNNTI